MKNISLLAMGAFILIYTLFGDNDAIDIGITQVPINIAEIGGPIMAALLGILYQYFPSLKKIFKNLGPDKDPLKLLNDLEVLVGDCPKCRSSCGAIREKLLDQRFHQPEE